MIPVRGTDPGAGPSTASTAPADQCEDEEPGSGAARATRLRNVSARLRTAITVSGNRLGSGESRWLALRVGILLLAAVGLELLLGRLTRLRPEAYFDASLIAALVERILGHLPTALVLPPLLAVGMLIAFHRRSLGPGWRDFDHGPRLGALVVVAAGLLAWIHATYAYNLYLDQTHAVERLLILCLVPLIAWRPFFLLPFLLILLPLLWQFRYPIGGFSSAAPMLPIRILMLAAAFWGLRLVTDKIRGADLLFLICCLVLAHYWVPGMAKLRLGWLTNDQLAFLLSATYANGWLGFLEPEAIDRLARGIASVNTPAKVATLLVECGALVALWRPMVTRLVLLGAIGLHAAVFLVSGINFWSWCVINLLLVVFFFRPRGESPPIFTSSHFLLSLALIGWGAIWFKPTELAWLDSRMSYTHRLEGVGVSGRSYELSPRFFAPYDYQFTLSGFRYLAPAPQLEITWGAMGSRELAAALRASTSPADVLALENAMGENPYDPERAENFDDFVRTFLATWHERGGNRGWWTRIGPPPLLWTFSRGSDPDPADRIHRVVVRQVTSLFDDRRYREIRTRTVRVIDVPPPPSPVERRSRRD